MRRWAITCFLFAWFIPATVLSGFAEKKGRTVTIESCKKLDYEEINLNYKRNKYYVVWQSTGGEFVIVFGPGTSACASRSNQPSSIFLTSNANPSDACYVNPSIVSAGSFKYQIWSKDNDGNLVECNDPAVVVNNGHGFNRETEEKRSFPDVKESGKSLDKMRAVNIDEACMPDTTPNLYISDKSTLVWTADNAQNGVLFKIDFPQDQTPCLDSDGSGGVTPQPVTHFEVTSGPGSHSQTTCYVNTSSPPKDNYQYSVTGGNPACTWSPAFVNVRK